MLTESYKVYIMSSKTEYILNILGNLYQVKRTLPKRIENSSSRIHNVLVDPFEHEIGLSNQQHFKEARKLFENNWVVINNELTAEEFKSQAKERFPELAAQSVNTAYDAYARERFSSKGWSQLLQSRINKLLERFDVAFEKLNIIDNEMVIEMSDPYPFLRRHLTCEMKLIKEFKLLGQQGHAFSQYMAGLLLTTMAGDFSEKGISYLITAYENGFPRSMDSLAEYLLYREDYLGATQCSLLSIDSLDDSKHTWNRILEHTSSLMVEPDDAPVGGYWAFSKMMPLSHYILHFALDEKFKTLANKHFPELYPSREKMERAAVDFILHRGNKHE